MIHLSLATAAAGLVALTVAIHAGGLAELGNHLQYLHTRPPTRVLPITWLLIRVTWMLLLIHLTEISIWALFYLYTQCMPNAEAAFYFSGTTYTSIGYGDLVLQKPWRMLGPIEGLTGILMCGLSAGFFFAVLSKVFIANSNARRK